jgi:hypothetical protein
MNHTIARRACRSKGTSANSYSLSLDSPRASHTHPKNDENDEAFIIVVFGLLTPWPLRALVLVVYRERVGFVWLAACIVGTTSGGGVPYMLFFVGPTFALAVGVVLLSPPPILVSAVYLSVCHRELELCRRCCCCCCHGRPFSCCCRLRSCRSVLRGER